MHASYISYFNVIAPLTTLSLGLLLVGCWNFARTQKELLWISAGYILPALLILAQSGVDNDGLARWTLVTSPIYISSAWFLGYGLALRYKTKSHPLVAFCVVIACMALLYYFSIISPNLPLRIIILNVGILIAQTLALPSILISAKSFTIWDRLLLSSFILYTLLILFRIVVLVTNNASDTDILTRSPYWRYLLTSTLFFGLWFMAILLGTTITGIVSKLRHERDHDPLTGLLNRRGFTERAQDKLKAHQHLPASILSFDIDHFKDINDTFGHGIGDDVLRSVSNILQMEAGDQHLAARFGGEEFVLLLTDTGIRKAEEFAAQIQNALQNIQLHNGPSSITASFGVSTLPTYQLLGTALKKADDALYSSKKSGRDRISIAT